MWDSVSSSLIDLFVQFVIPSFTNSSPKCIHPRDLPFRQQIHSSSCGRLFIFKRFLPARASLLLANPCGTFYFVEGNRANIFSQKWCNCSGMARYLLYLRHSPNDTLRILLRSVYHFLSVSASPRRPSHSSPCNHLGKLQSHPFLVCVQFLCAAVRDGAGLYVNPWNLADKGWHRRKRFSRRRGGAVRLEGK